MISLKSDMLFECSWEVCNKVGGIFTVVKSKAAQMVEHYKDGYFLIGPYFADKVAGQFEEHLPEEGEKLISGEKKIVEELKNEGIILHAGKWLIDGEPNVVLVDFSNFTGKLNDWKRWLWENYQIDSLGTEYFDFDQPMIWAIAVGKVLERFAKSNPDSKISAQFHEWLAGAALLYLKKTDAKIGTVFTTHATMLGRTLASTGKLYEIMDDIDPVKAAYEHHIQAKYLAERRCADNADVFTTVSEITGIEAKALLKRKPDVLLLNGLNLDKFPTFEESAIKHKTFKNLIKEFISYYFFPYYTFDIQKTLIFFLAGRYEFHDKGVDIYIRALGQLNERLKKAKSDRKVVAFFWVPGNIRGIKHTLLENRTRYEDIKDGLEEEWEDMKIKLLDDILEQKDIRKEELMSPDLLMETKSKLLKFKQKGLPPLSTHDLYDEPHDQIISTLMEVGLDNKEDDPVKIIFYPIYLTGADGLLNTSYYESMQGAHLGVFPSFYEPWGYTPLEAGALGVSSVTTDLAGFGRYIQGRNRNKDAQGIFVLKRMGLPDEDVIKQLTKVMFDYCKLSAKGRIKNKISAKELAGLADWSILVENYIKAHNLAVERTR
ncbi:hypothetical protein GF351_01625 [Candidatus Woesearchaeota archaeon]|nr:hypothetical protein [Candidatus Woesearchaeota archaeon]